MCLQAFWIVFDPKASGVLNEFVAAFKKSFTVPVAIDTFEFCDAADDEDGSVEEDGFDKLSALFIQD